MPSSPMPAPLVIWRRRCAFDSSRRSPRLNTKLKFQLKIFLTHLRVRWISERRPGGTTGGTHRRSSDTVFRLANISSSDSNSSSWLCVVVSVLILGKRPLCVFGIDLNLFRLSQDSPRDQAQQWNLFVSLALQFSDCAAVLLDDEEVLCQIKYVL